MTKNLKYTGTVVRELYCRVLSQRGTVTHRFDSQKCYEWEFFLQVIKILIKTSIEKNSTDLVSNFFKSQQQHLSDKVFFFFLVIILEIISCLFFYANLWLPCQFAK
jgi:hypothetical protein